MLLCLNNQKISSLARVRAVSTIRAYNTCHEISHIRACITLALPWVLRVQESLITTGKAHLGQLAGNDGVHDEMGH